MHESCHHLWVDHQGLAYFVPRDDQRVGKINLMPGVIIDHPRMLTEPHRDI